MHWALYFYVMVSLVHVTMSLTKSFVSMDTGLLVEFYLGEN